MERLRAVRDTGTHYDHHHHHPTGSVVGVDLLSCELNASRWLSGFEHLLVKSASLEKPAAAAVPLPNWRRATDTEVQDRLVTSTTTSTYRRHLLPDLQRRPNGTCKHEIMIAGSVMV